MKKQGFIRKKTFTKEKKEEISPSIFKFQPNRKSLENIQSKKKKKNLYRFVKWPKYIRIQRQRRILSQRLKVPPMIDQFTRVLDKNLTKKIFQLLIKYKSKNKNDRITNKKNKILKENSTKNKKKNGFFFKHGISSVADLIRKKKALFVLIANDVNPIELVIWLPSLCKKLEIPFCILRNKARLGDLVDRKRTSCLAIESFLTDNKDDMKKIIDCFQLNFNQNLEKR